MDRMNPETQIKVFCESLIKGNWKITYPEEE